MGSLTRVWKYLHSWERARPVPAEVHEDVLLALAQLPLMTTSLRSPLSSVITCSDASEKGAGAYASIGVTMTGKEAPHGPPADGDRPRRSPAAVAV